MISFRKHCQRCSNKTSKIWIFVRAQRIKFLSRSSDYTDTLRSAGWESFWKSWQPLANEPILAKIGSDRERMHVSTDKRKILNVEQCKHRESKRVNIVLRKILLDYQKIWKTENLRTVQKLCMQLIPRWIRDYCPISAICTTIISYLHNCSFKVQPWRKNP